MACYLRLTAQSTGLYPCHLGQRHLTSVGGMPYHVFRSLTHETMSTSPGPRTPDLMGNTTQVYLVQEESDLTRPHPYHLCPGGTNLAHSHLCGFSPHPSLLRVTSVAPLVSSQVRVHVKRTNLSHTFGIEIKTDHYLVYFRRQSQKRSY